MGRGCIEREVAWETNIYHSTFRAHHPPWCGEVIARALGVLEEVLGHLSTDSVTPAVPRIRPERCPR